MGHILGKSLLKKIIASPSRWHYFFICSAMKRVCYAVSLVLLALWVSIFFVFHAGFFSHTLILLSVLFFLQGIILVAPKKIPKEAE